MKTGQIQYYNNEITMYTENKSQKENFQKQSGRMGTPGSTSSRFIRYRLLSKDISKFIEIK